MAWAVYQGAFWERYGAGCLVPLRDAVHLAAGAGLPPGYWTSAHPEPAATMLPRDERLAELAWATVARGETEVVLDDGLLGDLAAIADLAGATGGGAGPDRAAGGGVIAPHVEMGIRVQAATLADLDAIRAAYSRHG